MLKKNFFFYFFKRCLNLQIREFDRIQILWTYHHYPKRVMMILFDARVYPLDVGSIVYTKHMDKITMNS